MRVIVVRSLFFLVGVLRLLGQDVFTGRHTATQYCARTSTCYPVYTVVALQRFLMMQQEVL